MLKLVKLTGAGNTFLLIDFINRENRKLFLKVFGRISRKKMAHILCNAHSSVGADGLVFLETSRVADVKWDFYNSDGSKAEMCGNAARCVGRYLVETSIAIMNKRKDRWPRHFTLETQKGVLNLIVKSVRSDSKSTLQVVVEMPVIEEFRPNQYVAVGKEKVQYDFVNSGVPHAVVKLAFKSLPQLIRNVDKLVQIVDSIRSLSQFSKRGTNVTFYVEKDKNSIDSLTFERGVFGFTQACGTGAVAAAISFSKNKSIRVKVQVPGGKLQVDLTNQQPLLEGPAKYIADVTIPVK